MAHFLMHYYIFLVLFLVLFWIILVYNRMVVLSLRMRNAWAQIDVQLKRRYDLIPNLVEVAQGYLSYERETLESVVRARTQALQASGLKKRAEAETSLTQCLRTLFAVTENYPDLKANQNMLRLGEELTTTENRIAFSRQNYNDEVMRYNTLLQRIPSNLVAVLFAFKQADFFIMDDVSQKKNPEVKVR